MPERNPVGMEIKTLNNLLKRKLFELFPPPDDEEPTDMQGRILHFLFVNHNRQDVFQRDVEERFLIRRSTASRLLRVLEEKGILTREPVPQDARLKKLVMTPKAIEKHAYICQNIQSVESLLTKGLTEEELDAFFTVVEKMKANLM